jgi:SAM-dependent methyltransferase
MNRSQRRVIVPAGVGIVLLALAASLDASARTRAECEREYQPQTGQSGKDVIWVPTNDGLVNRMLRMAGVEKRDRVYDLGAGDGKIAIAAAKQFGATAVGVEYNPDMAKLAQCFAEADGVADRVRIVQGDIFETDFSEASVVTLYLLPTLNLRLRPTLLKMKPGTRVVSHSFLMDDWEPDERSQTEDGNAYLWIVPAEVDGAWMFSEKDGSNRFSLRLDQQFQNISGSAGGEQQKLTEAKLRGDQITLAFEEKGTPVKITGRVNGARIEAMVTRGRQSTTYIGTRS